MSFYGFFAVSLSHRSKTAVVRMGMEGGIYDWRFQRLANRSFKLAT